MGKIDVTDVLSDPDFMTPLGLINRTPDVDKFGQLHLTEKAVATYGCVQPATGKVIQKLPEALRVPDVQSFWIKGKIVADQKCKYPDVIVSNGRRFLVQVVFDWSDWGEGWSEGTCVRDKPA